MATINQIPMTIMGNIVKNLEPKRTAGGKTVVAFRVAQTSVTERNGRWEDGETTFIRCVAYGHATGTPIAADPTCSTNPRGERRSMAQRGPGPFRRTTGTGFLKKKNSRAHDIRPIVMGPNCFQERRSIQVGWASQ